MNQLVTIDHPSNAEAYRASTDAATMCKDIVVATATTIQGRRYVAVEGWQAIAVAHGCTAGARSVERVEGGVRAIGEVRRMSDGTVIATAEGFVGEDEPTWYGGPSRGKTLPKRPDYAIRAMAQTRAISRACRSAFAHVVVMMKAGLATTPAEEVPFDGFDRETGEIVEAAPQPVKVPGIQKIKDAIREMKAEGNAADNLEGFNRLLENYADQMKALEQAQHSWWTGKDGDGNEFEGIPAWIARRREELSADNAVVSGLIASMKQCETSLSLANWRAANESVVDALDGAEGRTFELAWSLHESAIREVEKVHN